MDLSTYYEHFQETYNLAVFALCLTVFAVLFVGIRRIIDKEETIRTKIIVWIILILMFASVLNQFLVGPNLAKKDIEQKTIYYYEGSFEITETTHGIYDKATFRFDNQEITLKYSEDDYEEILPGKYDGKFIYAQHLAQILYLDTLSLKTHNRSFDAISESNESFSSFTHLLECGNADGPSEFICGYLIGEVIE